jgi:membrane protein DedA with SNARE-associated domain
MPKHANQDDRLFTDYCDSKANWGPLVIFRPMQDEQMGVGRTFAMSVLLGLLFGVPGSVVLLVVGRLLHRPDTSLFAMPTVLTAVYFAAAWLTFVPAWNRRAARLARISKR